MFEQKITKPCIPRYIRIGPYIVNLDQVHGVMHTKTENKEFPFQIYLTYSDKTTVVLDISSKEECDKACDKIAECLGAI